MPPDPTLSSKRKPPIVRPASDGVASAVMAPLTQGVDRNRSSSGSAAIKRLDLPYQLRLITALLGEHAHPLRGVQPFDMSVEFLDLAPVFGVHLGLLA